MQTLVIEAPEAATPVDDRQTLIDRLTTIRAEAGHVSYAVAAPIERPVVAVFEPETQAAISLYREPYYLRAVRGL